MIGTSNSVLTTNGNTLSTWTINFNKPAGTTLKVTDDFVNPSAAINVTSGNLDMSNRNITLALVSDAGKRGYYQF